MFLVDANVLIYAVNTDGPHHEAARSWLDDALAGSAGVGLPWVVLLAFLRLATNRRIFPDPLTIEGAVRQVDSWVQAPAALVVHPTARHLPVLAGLLDEVVTGANLVTDAHLGALAVEHNATIVSFDRDLMRFTGLKLHVPSVPA